MTDAEGPPPQDQGATHDEVIALGIDAPSESKQPSIRRPMGRVHGAAIMGMATSALVGIGAMLAFITVSWPGEMGHYVVVVFFFAVIAFMASASIAVFTAARGTYPNRDTEDN